MKKLSVHPRRLLQISVLCLMSMFIGTACGDSSNASEGPVLSAEDTGILTILNRSSTCLFDTGVFDDVTCTFN